MTGLNLDKLLEKLGISAYLLDTPCSPSSGGWTDGMLSGEGGGGGLRLHNLGISTFWTHPVAPHLGDGRMVSGLEKKRWWGRKGRGAEA